MIKDPPPLTLAEKRKWLAEFERLGVHDVREHVWRDKFNPEVIERLAVQWLRDHERAADRCERGTF